MSKLSTLVLAITLVLGTTAVLANSKALAGSSSSKDALLESDGAFRDGLYLGKLAAESGQPPRLALGRWSGEQDRSRFVDGYRRGYTESLASLGP